MSDKHDVFFAIADSKRREIIERLAVEKHAITLNAISERFTISRQAVRKHMTILHEAGLVDFKKRGREKYCQLNLEPLRRVYQWLAIYEQFWGEKLIALEKYLDQ